MSRRNWYYEIVVVLLLLVNVYGASAQNSLPIGSGLDGIARLKEGRSMRASSSDPDLAGNADNRTIDPGQTVVVAELEGPGIITHIWNTIASQERGHTRLLTLRMYWDGEELPSVECPIGDFFGIGHGLNVPFSSAPVAVSADGRGRNCYWPMPFRKSAKITLTNDGKMKCDAFYFYIDWQKLDRLEDDTAYFHAMYRQEHPVQPGVNYLIADIKGRGHYVGTVLNVRQHLGSWWGEGDDFFFIDGESTPSLRGTGTEDYFCDGWGFRKFSNPYYGAPLTDPLEPGGRHSVYRWHIPDPVSFQTSLRLEIKHWGVTFKENGEVKSGFEERFDDFSSVAFWYQLEPHAPFEPIPSGKDRLYRDYDTMVEGESLLDQVKVSDGVVERQELPRANDGAHLWWRTEKANQSLEFPVNVAESGLYEITVFLTASRDYGVFELLLDGRPLNTRIDAYNPNVVFGETTIFDFPIEAGAHVLRVVNKGKSNESTGYQFGLDGYIFKRVPNRK